MTKETAFGLIINEYIKIYKIENNNDLLQWFWNVGFRDIIIDEEKKHIKLIVSRPNRFISKYQRNIVNFLIYLTNNVFSPMGYEFELAKDTNDWCYNQLKKNYIEKQIFNKGKQ